MKRSILMSIIWYLEAKFFPLFLDEDENPIISGRIIKIVPNEDLSEGGSIVSIQRKNGTIESVSFDTENDPLKKWNLHINEMANLSCTIKTLTKT